MNVIITILSMLLIVWPFFTISSISESNYCKIDKNHIMCGQSTLKNNSEFLKKINSHDKHVSVKNFNRYRNYIQYSNTNSSASNMQKLKWNPDCAKAAKLHASYCSFPESELPEWCQHNCKYCKSFDGFEVGVFSSTSLSSGTFEAFTRSQTIEAMHKAEPGYIYKEGDHNNIFAVATSANLTEIGCSMVDYGVHVYGFCVFGGINDMVGKKLYLEGESCSRCPPGSKCSEDYENLCEMIEQEEVLIKSLSFDDIFNLEGWSMNEEEDQSAKDFSYSETDEDESVNIGDSPKEDEEENTGDQEEKPSDPGPKGGAKASRDSTAAGVDPNVGQISFMLNLFSLLLIIISTVSSY